MIPVKEKKSAAQDKRFVIIFIVLYWLLAWYFEQLKAGSTIDLLKGWSNPEQTSTFLMILTAFIVDLMTATAHFIPLIIGWYLAPKLIIPLLQNLYQFDTPQEAEQFLFQLEDKKNSPSFDRRSEKNDFEMPLLARLELDQLEQLKEVHPWLKWGHGGRIKIKDEHAVVIEKNGRFHRILSGGVHRLQPFEIVKEIIDLEKQEDVFHFSNRLMTQDGMPLTTSIHVVYQIAPNNTLYAPVETAINDQIAQPLILGDQLVSFELDINQPFSFSEQAVYNATYHKSIERIDEDESNLSNETNMISWKEFVPKIIHYNLNELVANYTFDDLISEQNRSNATLQLQEELHILTQKRVRTYGVWISNLSIQLIQPIRTIRNLIEKQRILSQTSQIYATHPSNPTYQAQAELIQAILVKTNLADIEKEFKFPSLRPIAMNRLAQALLEYTSNIPQLKIKYPDLFFRLQQIDSHTKIGPPVDKTHIEVNNE